jgi:ADP-ribose pyrophosphatase YjhB (NUDIX family)
VAFDPARRNAWKSERGRILLVMRRHHPNALLAREIWTLIGGHGSPNQTCTRLGELLAQGLVERTGIERLTETGTVERDRV